MRIGLSGAQGVGKTTLLEALSNERIFKDYSICSEVTRWVRSLGIDINESGTDITQRLIAYKHIFNLTMFDKMITDRTILDCLVYTKWLHRQGRVSQQCLSEVKSMFDKIYLNYDYIFYIQPEFELVDDNVRSVNVDFRDEIVELFADTLFEHLDPNNYTILTGTVENRVKQVKETLKVR